MAESDETKDAPETKPSRRPQVIGLALVTLGAAGGFYATWSGMIPMSAYRDTAAEVPASADSPRPVSMMPDVAFVPVTPLIVSVGQGAKRLHLRFSAELEVKSAHKAEVEDLMPRIVDVMNTYLRALKLADLEDSMALVRLRAQLLRRLQVVTGGGRINDLLVVEFVLS
jgi:flagellar FliL protein